MYCTKCGKQNPDGKNYCTFCGAPLKKPAAANTPGRGDKQRPQKEKQRASNGKKDTKAKAAKPQNPQNEQKNKPKKKLWKVVAAVAAVAALAIAGVLGFVLFNNGDNEADDLNAYIDAEKYYEENSEIISTIDAKKSKDVQTESEVKEEVSDRGFEQYPITFDCSIKGDYQGEKEISETSDEKHPSYRTYYVSGSKEIWTINVINGDVTAYPVMYNQEHEGTQTIISEKDTVISYDVATNTYFENKPNKSAVNLIVVGRIDAETLEDMEL